MNKQNKNIISKKQILFADLKEALPNLTDSEIENILVDLKRVPELFKKLLTETQVNLRVYERYRGRKKTRIDYKLDLDTTLQINDRIK